MITYVDTSTLIKLLIDEVGTKEAGLIWDEPDVLVSSRVGHVEARAALAAARRQGRISAVVFRAAVEGLEVLWSQVSVVEIDEDLMRLAGDLAVAHSQRGYDATIWPPRTSSVLTCSAVPIAACAKQRARPASMSPIRSMQSRRRRNPWPTNSPTTRRPDRRRTPSSPSARARPSRGRAGPSSG